MLQCYQCGTYVKEKPVLLGAVTTDGTYNEFNVTEFPTCNNFNASLSIYWTTCKPEEKGCLKGWLTQVCIFIIDRPMGLKVAGLNGPKSISNNNSDDK